MSYCETVILFILSLCFVVPRHQRSLERNLHRHVVTGYSFTLTHNNAIQVSPLLLDGKYLIHMTYLLPI